MISRAVVLAAVCFALFAACNRSGDPHSAPEAAKNAGFILQPEEGEVLRLGGAPGGQVVKGLDKLESPLIIHTDFYSQGTLAYGRNHFRHWKEVSYFLLKSQPSQAGSRQDDSVQVPLSDLPDAGVNVAPNGGHDEVSPQQLELDATAKGTRTQARFLGQLLKGLDLRGTTAW